MSGWEALLHGSDEPANHSSAVNFSVTSPELPANDETVLLGICMGLTASIGINLGNNMQALALSKQKANGLSRKPAGFWMGTVLFALSSIVNFAAFPFAPAAVLAPLESVQFVSNLLFAKLVNKRSISCKMYLGSILIIGGTVLTVSFGPNQVIEFSNLDEIALLWLNLPWVVYIASALTLAIVCLWVHKALEARPGAYTVLPPLTFAVSAAIAGSSAVVQAKAVGEIVSIFLAGHTEEVLGHWFFYASLALLLVFLTLWLTRLNLALTKFDPIFIIPLVQSLYILFSLLAGGFFFEEFQLMTTKLAWGMFVGGVCVMFFGLALLIPTDPSLSNASKKYFCGAESELTGRSTSSSSLSSTGLPSEHLPTQDEMVLEMPSLREDFAEMREELAAQKEQIAALKLALDEALKVKQIQVY